MKRSSNFEARNFEKFLNYVSILCYNIYLIEYSIWKFHTFLGLVNIIPARSDANAFEPTTKWNCRPKSHLIQNSTTTLPKERIRYSNIFKNPPTTKIGFELWRDLILELLIRQNRNSHLFYSDVTATEQRLKTGDDNERESKLRLVKMSKTC